MNMNSRRWIRWFMLTIVIGLICILRIPSCYSLILINLNQNRSPTMKSSIFTETTQYSNNLIKNHYRINRLNHNNKKYFRLSMNSESSSLSQLRLEFDCDDIDSDELSEMILELGPLSVSVESIQEKNVMNDESRWADLQKTKSWATARLRANFPSSFDIKGVIDMINELYPERTHSVIVENIKDIDWVTEVQKNWKPQIIDDLMIQFPWHLDENINTLTMIKHKLILEGGSAFGTGDHPTTRLCCRWLNKIIQSLKMNQNNDYIRVLDYGCGSGILGLSALRFGADEAIGVDIDRDSLVSAKKNSLMNNLEMPLYIAYDNEDVDISSEVKSIVMNNLRGKADGVDDFDEESAMTNKVFDITIANILAPILISLAPVLAAYTKKDGRIGLSGIVDVQVNAVIVAYEKYFHSMKIESQEDEWVVLTGIRR